MGTWRSITAFEADHFSIGMGSGAWRQGHAAAPVVDSTRCVSHICGVRIISNHFRFIEEADDDSDDEVEAGGVVQDYLDPLTRQLLENPMTS